MGIREQLFKNVVFGSMVLFSHGCSVDSHRSINQADTFLIFGDSGYRYDYIPYWYSDVIFKSKEEFDAEFQPYWEKVKGGPIADFVVPPSYLHEDLGGYIHATGMNDVAYAMREHCEESACAFGVMLGDNIYPAGATLGADGLDDNKRLDAMLSEPYSAIAADNRSFRIYSVLGNHDWESSRGGAFAQVRYLENHPRFYMDGINYNVSPPGTNSDIEIFAIDTNVLLASETVFKNGLDSNGHPIATSTIKKWPVWQPPQTEAEREMLLRLENALKNSSARWKFVIGHHPLWSSGGRRSTETQATRRLLLPILCKYADAYFSGHEHSLEVHSDDCGAYGKDRSESPLLHVVSGAASRMNVMNKGFVKYQAAADPHFSSLYVKGSVWGYAAITVTPDSAVLKIMEVAPEVTGEKAHVGFEIAFRPLILPQREN